MRIVFATSSAHRQALYREAIEGLGHEAFAANGGVECLALIRTAAAELLLLEAPLLWGGCDGVLDVVQNELAAKVPVILVAVGSGSIDWFQLSRFHVDDFLFRTPTAHEIEQSIQNLAGRRAPTRHTADANKRQGEERHTPILPHPLGTAAYDFRPHAFWNSGNSASPAGPWAR